MGAKAVCLSIRPPFGPTSAVMQDDDLTTVSQPLEPEAPIVGPGKANRVAVGVVVSVALHALLLAALLFNFSVPRQDQAQEEVVSVEMVPEPEPPAEPEPEPPPEPPKQDAEQPAPPPPPPPPPSEAPEETPAQASTPLPTLDPVFRFGEETQGAEQPQDGDGASAAEPEPAKVTEQEPKAQETPAPDLDTEPPQPVEEAQQEPVPEAEEPPPDAGTAGALPEMLATQLAQAAQVAPAETPDDMPGETPEEAAVPVAKVVPLPRPAQPVSASSAAATTVPALREVKRIYSRAATGSTVAMTAMAGLPAGERAGRLCSTELREQLRRGSPAYEAEVLPAYTLAAGTSTLTVRQGAFRAGGQWYNVGFQCSVDADATEVRSFSLAVGSPVPRSDWQRRGFPQF